MPIPITATTRAAIVAGNMGGSLIQASDNIHKLQTEGLPANGANPAVTGAQITAALDPVAIKQFALLAGLLAATDGAKLDAALAALS